MPRIYEEVHQGHCRVQGVIEEDGAGKVEESKGVKAELSKAYEE
jgi:hypothetical protein